MLPSRPTSAGLGCIYQDGWRSLPILQGHPPPSTSQFTGCEPQLGEETGLNLEHGLGINWGFTGSFMFLIHPFWESASPWRGAIERWAVQVAVPGAQPVPVGLGMVGCSVLPLLLLFLLFAWAWTTGSG